MLRFISNGIVRQKGKIVLSQSLCTKLKSRKTSKPSMPEKTDVVGLSNKCLEVPNTPVGPGAAKDKEYKNPEYFCYHINTFGEAEVELAKYRLPAPSNKIPFKQ